MLFNGQAFMQFGGWTPVIDSQLDISNDNENRYQLYRHRAINLKAGQRSQKFGNFNKGKENEKILLQIIINIFRLFQFLDII